MPVVNLKFFYKFCKSYFDIIILERLVLITRGTRGDTPWGAAMVGSNGTIYVISAEKSCLPSTPIAPQSDSSIWKTMMNIPIACHRWMPMR